VATSGAPGANISIADASRGDGKRFVVRAGEKLNAFLELESAIRETSNMPEAIDNIASRIVNANHGIV